MDVTPEVDATNPNTLEVTPRANKRTAHCHRQAAECALAATTVVSSEIKAAYRNIEQASLGNLALAALVLGGAQVLVSAYGNPVLGSLTIVILAVIILRFR